LLYGGPEFGGDPINDIDFLYGDAGNDTLNGGIGEDNLNGGLNDDTLFGGEGNDILWGGTELVIRTNTGNDTLNGRGGDDKLNGQDGNDTYIVDSLGDIVTENLAEGFDVVESYIDIDGYTLVANVEQLILRGSAIRGNGNTLDNLMNGNDAHNTLKGEGGDDTLRGGGGNDTLIGGSGNDSLVGVLDNDSLQGGVGDDIYDIGDTAKIIENLNEGTDTVKIFGSYKLGDNIENLELLGNGTDNGTGNNLNNNIIGNNANNILNGKGGNDSLYGGAGNDSLKGDEDNDYLYGDSGINILNGGAGDDVLDGWYSFFSGVDSDKNTMKGGEGNDFYYVDSGDKISESSNEGIDTVNATISFTLPNNVENLIFDQISGVTGKGNKLNNTIEGYVDSILDGRDGNDILTGYWGNQTLVGGKGSDTLTGGSGDDRFVFKSTKEGIDNIIDFSVVDDTIEVSKAGFGARLTANAAITSAQFTIGSAAVDSSDRFIYNNSTGGLFFDVDGIGGTGQVQLATLSTNLVLTNADIFVIA
jgi:Ca2+-binding RTX toxin-like protein